MPRPRPLTLLIIAIAAGLCAPPAQAALTPVVFLPAVSCPTCTGSGGAPDLLEARMIELVNEARLAAECPAATPNVTLMRITGEWSEYMDSAEDYSHGDMTAKYRAYPGGVLENIAGGSDSAEYVFEGWMASPLHRRNLEWCLHPDNPSYEPSILYEIGVGFHNGYWTLAIGDRAP